MDSWSISAKYTLTPTATSGEPPTDEASNVPESLRTNSLQNNEHGKAHQYTG